MDKQNAQKIVEGLRAAADAKGAVVELLGQEARNFKFVKEPDRKVLVGSFRVEVGRTFFVSVVSSPRNDDDFSFVVFERPTGNVILASNLAGTDGIHWKYQLAKQHGDNQARKKAFVEAAGSDSDSIAIPFPTRSANRRGATCAPNWSAACSSSACIRPSAPWTSRSRLPRFIST